MISRLAKRTAYFLVEKHVIENEDVEAYPRDLEHDAAICEAGGVDIIFHPEVSEMYGPDFQAYVDMNVLPEKLCR